MNKIKTDEISLSKTTRKIGRTTYIVSSNYAQNNQQNLVSMMARLIQSDATLKTVADRANSA